MANDKDSEQFVLRSKVRTGLKREFENAMKAQSQICWSHGRTRANKNRDAVHDSGSKRFKKSGSLNENPSCSVKKNEEEERRVLSEEEAKSGAMDAEKSKNQLGESFRIETVSENKVPRTGLVSDTASTSKKTPWKLKDLLSSGVLEGMIVNYVRGIKAKKDGVLGLQGVIRGQGIACSCEGCDGGEVMGATAFEKHAGSGNKRPAEYIQLQNRNTLRDVLDTCSNTPLANLEEAVQNVIGCLSLQKSSFCFKCRGVEDVNDVSKILCNRCTSIRDQSRRDQGLHKTELEEGLSDVAADIAYFHTLMSL